MPHTLVAAQPPAIVMTRVWMHEHDWLHSVYASHANQSPTFRFPDLLSACIELVLSSTESLARLQLFLGTELGARDPKAPRRPANVSLNESLLAAAKELDINISRAAEDGVAQAVKKKREQQWLEENKAALESSNEWVRKHGLPLAKYRQF